MAYVPPYLRGKPAAARATGALVVLARGSTYYIAQEGQYLKDAFARGTAERDRINAAEHGGSALTPDELSRMSPGVVVHRVPLPDGGVRYMVPSNPPRYGFPKGGIEMKDRGSSAATASRELREETGISIPEIRMGQPIGSVRVGDGSYDVYRIDGTTANTEPGYDPKSSEQFNPRWLTLDQIRALPRLNPATSSTVELLRGRGGGRTRRLRLKTLRRSHKKEKKWDAVFEQDGEEKVVPFGQRGYSDFTKHKDTKRRQRYIDRHSGMGEDWKDPTTPGALSRYILWNKKTLRASLRDFKKKFHV